MLGNLKPNTEPLIIGADALGGLKFNGTIDSVRISNVARSADQIRQAYEIGRRTHPITIDFVSAPSSAYTSGTSISIADPSGISLAKALFKGDELILRENEGGTEYISQATVTNVSGNTVTIDSQLSSIPPTSGFTTNATAFKWQREWFDLSASLSAHRDAVTRLTFRVSSASEGRTFWLDDFKSGGPYLTTAAGSSITSSAAQYMQYRFCPSTTDTNVSPNVSNVRVDHTMP